MPDKVPKKCNYTIWNVCVQGDGCFIGPAASHIADGVSSSTQHEQWEVEGLHVLHTFCVAWWKSKILSNICSFQQERSVHVCMCVYHEW